jgi:subtilisin family serine protease
MRLSLSLFFLFTSFLSFTQQIEELPISYGMKVPSEKMRLFVQADIEQLLSLESRGILQIISKRTAYQLISTDSEGLQELIDTGTLRYMNTGTQLGRPLNDLMITNNNILPVHQGISPLNVELTGAGVIMGIIDTGIELLHPDFLNEDGTTRVIELWDHTFEFDDEHIPQPYGFGTKWTQEEINAGIAVHEDQAIWFGHGSTVTGTACGNGSAVNDFIGVAPNSDMVIVSFDFSSSNFLEDVSQAVEYIFEVADAEGKPCVINMSLGSYFGSHDGLDPAALFIDELLEQPGRLITAAVGNSNSLDPYHLGVQIENDTSFTWFEYESSLGVGGSGVFFELWADTVNMAELLFSVGADRTELPYSARGMSESIFYQESIGQIITKDILNSNGDLLGEVQYWSQYRGEQVQIQVMVSNSDSSQYDFRFQSIGTGAYDIWSTSVFGTSDMINSEDLPSENEFPDIANYKSPDNRMQMVSSWTCSDRVITVANYMNRVSYIDYTGNITSVPGIQGDINISSSAGPTRDGRQKPDIAATGSVTLSTGNFPMLNFLIQNEPFKVAQGGMHFRNGGSSMASPVLAGIAALYLEQCPQADW